MKVAIYVDYEIEDTVYLKTDIEQRERMVIAYEVAKDCTFYKLACGDEYSYHFGYELTRDKRAI